MLLLEARSQRGKLDAMVSRVKPVLDYVDMEVAPQPDDRPPRPDAIIDRCKAHGRTSKASTETPLS